MARKRRIPNLGLKTHGMVSTSEYQSWKAMKSRCLNPNRAWFKHYGARGITVCDQWIDSFETFYNDMGPRPKRHSLDRINNDLGYFKENCRWANNHQQSRNKTTTRLLTVYGITKNMADWADFTEQSISGLHARLKKGMEIKKAIFLGPQKRGPRKDINDTL